MIVFWLKLYCLANLNKYPHQLLLKIYMFVKQCKFSVMLMFGSGRFSGCTYNIINFDSFSLVYTNKHVIAKQQLYLLTLQYP